MSSRDLFRFQDRFQRTKQIFAPGVLGERCGSNPGVGRLWIFCRASALRVHVSELDTSSRMSLDSCSLEPVKRCGIVLPNTVASQIHVGKNGLAQRIAGIGRFAIPGGCGRSVPLTTQSLIVQITEIRLCAAIASLSPFLKPAKRFLVVLPHTLSLQVENPEVIVGASEVLIGSRS